MTPVYYGDLKKTFSSGFHSRASVLAVSFHPFSALKLEIIKFL